MMQPRPGSAFKRLETDAEFVARLGKPPIDLHPPTGIYALAGAQLDDYAWTNRQVQRRIVDDNT
jgi:hypothetical protein